MSTADKLLGALSLFTFEKPEWTVEAATDALGVSGSTAYRYFSSLTKAGLLDPISNGRYILGPAIIAYDRQLRHWDPLIKVAHPALEKLVQRNSGEGIGLLCRRFRQQVMCVHQYNETQPDQAVSYERGRPMGMYRGAASLVILAHLPGRDTTCAVCRRRGGDRCGGAGPVVGGLPGEAARHQERPPSALPTASSTGA